ncbi:FAD binding domain-containing protein [Phyllosticta capitalensis]|uniref:FAD binding domain-containing protein n=1 Tax=Phyllosticta capitalensis TaxID=121624 RepID=A0ABR1Z2W6_9PEZI
MSLLSSAVVGLLAGSAAAGMLTCDTLKSQLQSNSVDGFTIAWSGSTAYDNESDAYWSVGCSDLKPACIIEPSDAQGVAAAIKVLNQNNETFSVKSGGHNPNQNFSSISGGPLISTVNLKEVTYDASTNTVRVGAGNRWQDIIEVLQGHNAAAVGGRIGHVGVGGFILGGGLSFLSSQYGWAANNVEEFEVVLANASIVTASSSHNTDLYKALKGGGPNFGVVTTYTLKTHPIGENGQVWGGNLWFGGDQNDAILAAVQNFTQNYPDPKAAIIATSEITVASLYQQWVIFLFYDGPEPPAGVFDMFTSLNPVVNNCKNRTYADLLTFNNWAVVNGSVYTISTATTPLAKDPNITANHLQTCYQHWENVTNSMSAVLGLVGSFAFQPYPTLFAKVASENGGDLMSFDEDADRIIFEFDYSYWPGTSDTDATVDQGTVQLYGGMKDIINQGVSDGRLPDVYRPVFMNDGYWREDYWGNIKKESREFAQRVRDSVDPGRFWNNRQAAGFKLP